MNIADTATSHALLNCLMREVAGRVTTAGPHVVVDDRLRVRLRGPAVWPAPRFDGLVGERRGGAWREAGWERLAELVAGELRARTGVANEEWCAQVAASHDAIAAIDSARLGRPAPADDYLESEQALVAGHRFHPTPKARSGPQAAWLAYAPEAFASFPLRRLAVRADLVREGHAGDPSALEVLDRLAAPLPPGYRGLPAHPWQLALLGDAARLRAALADGRLLDLGPAPVPVWPTSSVRTVYDPAADVFLKHSLDVRLTNCVRKNAWYELDGAVALTRLLAGLFAEAPGVVLLGEPAYRTVELGDLRLSEGLAVIVRDGVRGRVRPGLRPLLAAAVADEHGTSRNAVAELLQGGGPARALRWWQAYVSLLAPPVLHAFAAHGVVLEPHLQNVLVAVSGDGMPAQVVLRDLEGVKLVGERWADATAALPERVREALTYDAERGWSRVAYCLVVNHLAEVAAAVAGACPAVAPELWPAARAMIGGRRLLHEARLPAKANLRTRWARAADREAAYVAVANPLAGY